MDAVADEMDRWIGHQWHGSAASFHGMDLGHDRAVWLCGVDAPALILGSAQPDGDVDAASAARLSIPLVRRRSGGGAVFVDPAGCIWIDVTIPRDDPHWRDDVGASMLWLGEVFVEALSPWVAAEVHRGPYDGGEAGRQVCFASRSPGEVFVGGSKVVGISQRRTRGGARFQCALYREWTPTSWSRILTSAEAARVAESMQVATVPATGVEVLDSLVSILNR